MTGGHKIIGIWRDRDMAEQLSARAEMEAESEDAFLLHEDAAPISTGTANAEPPLSGTMDHTWGDSPPSRRRPVVQFTLAAAALAWSVYDIASVVTGPTPLSQAIPGLIATFSIPLVLIGIFYLIAMRNSRTEMRRFTGAAQAMRAEGEALEQRVAAMRAILADAQKSLIEQADQLQHHGAAATASLETTSSRLVSHVATMEGAAARAERTGAALSGHFHSLNESLPQIDDRAANISAQILDACDALADRLSTLEGKLEAITLLATDTRGQTAATTQSLAAQLDQMQEATRGASGEINDMAKLAASRIDMALERAQAAMDATRKGLDAQNEALGLMVDRSRGTLEALGSETIAGFAGHADRIEAKLSQLNTLIGEQRDEAAGLGTELEERLGALGSRFAAFEADGIARNERLGAAIVTLASEAERMERALADGNMTADQLIARSETLLVALDSGVREIDETLPLALGRLDGRIDQSRSLLSAANPELEKLEAVADAILSRVQEAEELLRTQSNALGHMLEATNGALAANRTQVDQLSASLRQADESAIQLSEGAAPQLVMALLRVKETADQAAEHARQALARSIGDAAANLGKASAETLDQVVAERIDAQMERIATVAEDALRATHQASERLTRQLLTIADTSANVEKRIEESNRAAEERDRDGFARRTALLIEALNSTAIDVTKLLSNEVADASWAAYLKGDRGVFTRRAVKLLDTAEARQVVQLYGDDPEFHEHVNRYIHDFEAMLRGILSVRDGSALGVTLLSSDMGKLYVALAQAIERLRN